MLDIKELSKAVRQVAEDKGLESDKIMEVIESSIAAAYKKEYGQRGEVIKCKLSEKTGDLQFWQVKTVVDETTVRFVEENEEEAAAAAAAEKADKRSTRIMVEEPEDEMKLPRYNPERHITLEDAKKIKKTAELGDELEFELESHDDFGRIAAQTAKQVILQKLRELGISGEFMGESGTP
jgi:N utilization substance protein A